MNKQIAVLLEQCKEDVLGVKVVNHQQFAELIIRECAAYCASQGTAPSIFSAEDLLTHFGISQ